MFMGFCGGGGNMENIFRYDKLTKYECVARTLLILKTYMEMKSNQIRMHMGFYGNGDSKAFANIENIYGNGKVTK